MKRLPVFLIGIAALMAMGCMGAVDGPEGDDPGSGTDTVVSVKLSLKAYNLANEYILSTRPKATSLLLNQVNLTLANNNILDKTVSSVESKVYLPLTTDEPPKTCPYLTKSGNGTTLNCRYLVDRAVEDALVASATLKSSVEQDIGNSHGSEIAVGEVAFVNGWAGQAIYSGIDVGSTHAVEQLRTAKACDQAPTQSESAFQLGESQGKALLEKTEKTTLPTIPKTQCNTDIIASTIYAEAKKAVDSFIKSAPLCDGYKTSDLAETVDLAKEEGNRLSGIQQGLKVAYEALRVRLVSTWVCEVPPPPPDPCLCYARYSGKGPVYCFPQSKFSHVPPSSGVVLAGMASQGIQQCQGNTQAAKPVGSPLVADLDDNGIQLLTETVRFDLAATGEPALVPALGGQDALLALDKDGNGAIDSGLELFGNATLCGPARCTDGLVALAQHDANTDGVLDAKDPLFARLRLWQDVNRDGRSQAAELSTLAEHGIRAIRLDSRLDLSWATALGSATRALTFVRDGGSTGALHDVWFNLGFSTLPRDPRSSGIVSTLPDRLR